MKARLTAVLASALAATLLTPVPAGAAPGDLDTSFSSDGKVAISGEDADDVLLQPDGRMLVAAAPDVLRLNSKGELDTSWGVAGTANHPHQGALPSRSRGSRTAGSEYITGTSGGDVICADDGDHIIQGGTGTT